MKIKMCISAQLQIGFAQFRQDLNETAQCLSSWTAVCLTGPKYDQFYDIPLEEMKSSLFGISSLLARGGYLWSIRCMAYNTAVTQTGKQYEGATDCALSTGLRMEYQVSVN